MNTNGLAHLDTHIAFLKKTIKTEKQMFLVGGCIRDILLDIEADPKDIDLTLAGSPEDIKSQISFGDLSHFATEKYGTITILKEDTKYELTPLRTESEYTDSRHPDEITRSDDLTLDAQRRDFTINSIYYTNCPKKEFIPSTLPTENKHSLTDILDKHKIAFLVAENLLIIQSPNHIQKLFTEGNLQDNYFAYLKNIMTEHMIIIDEKSDLEDNQETKKNKINKSKKTKKSDTLHVLLDPNGGIQDLINRKICAVGDANKRFQEDALRIMRAVRFACVLNQKLQEKKITSELFDIEKKTRASLKENYSLISNIAKERIREELVKAFGQGNAFTCVALFDEIGLLPIIFPSLAKTKYVDQPIRYHPFDVYTHTMLTLFELQKISKKYTLRLAMLYHDVGKVDQFKEYGNHLTKDQIRDILKGPLNHRRSSPELAKVDFQALGFSKKEVEEICRYIANHHKIEEIMDGENMLARKKKVRKFLSEAGLEKALDIMDITAGDRRGQYNPLQNNSDLTQIEEARKLLIEIHNEEGQFLMKDLVIKGDDIMRQFKIPAGPEIGILLKGAFERALGDIKKRNTKRELFGYVKGALKRKE